MPLGRAPTSWTSQYTQNNKQTKKEKHLEETPNRMRHLSAILREDYPTHQP